MIYSRITLTSLLLINLALTTELLIPQEKMDTIALPVQPVAITPGQRGCPSQRNCFNYYQQGSSIYYKASDKNLPLLNVDPVSFEVLMFYDERQKMHQWSGPGAPEDWRHVIYARDKNTIYYQGLPLEHSHAATFSWLGYGYSRDQTQLYYDGQVVAQADPNSFQIVDDTCIKACVMRDTTQIIIDGIVQPIYDANSFERISSEYTRDKDHLYHNHGIINGIDAASFTIIDNTHVKDKNYLYQVNNPGDFRQLSGIEPNTFEQFDQSAYARDRNAVYYYYQPIQGANPQSFVALTLDYGKDKQQVFYRKQAIPGDAATFSVIDLPNASIGATYTKDRYHVYFGNKAIIDADPNSFSIFSYTNSADSHRAYYSYDQQYIFHEGKVIPKADQDSFEIIDSLYSKDANQVFYTHIPLKDSDSNTLEILSFLYAKDKNHVYYQGNIMQGVKPQGFVLLKKNGYPSDHYAKSVDAVFYEGKKIDDANPKTFTIP